VHVTGVILAGGLSSRMGQDKSLLPFNDKPAIEHICEALAKASDDLIIISNHPEKYAFLDFPVYRDLFYGKGPLSGLHAAMHYHQSDAYMLAACDMPFIQPEIYKFLIEQLGEDEIIVPVYENLKQPLAAVYSRNTLPSIESLLQQDRLKMAFLFDLMKVKYQAIFPFTNDILEKHFFNMNHPEEYSKAKDWFK